MTKVTHDLKEVKRNIKKAKQKKAEGNYGLIDDNPGEREPIGLGDMLRIGSGLIGTSFSEAFLVSFLGPFATELGVPFTTSLWLIIPITSVIVQPCVGAWSDHCRWKSGRRRPYLLFGTIVLAFGQLLLGICLEVGAAINFSPYTVFMISLFIFNVGLSFQQVSLRALWADIVPPEQLPVIFSCGTFFQLGGYMLGYATTEVRWVDTPYFGFLQTPLCNATSLCFDVRVVSVMLASISWIANILVLISAEEPTVAFPAGRSYCSPIINILAGVKDTCSHQFTRRVIECTFLSWIGWWLFNIFIVHFVAKEIYGGLPDAPALSDEKQSYEEGVHFASGSMFLAMIVGWITAVGVPSIANWSGKATSWLSSYLLAAGMLLLGVVITHHQTRFGIAIWIALFGIPFAFQITIPYVLVLSNEELQHNTGVLVALLTNAIAIAQLIVATFGSYISQIAGTDLGSFAVGAVVLIIAAARCIWLARMEHEAAKQEKLKEGRASGTSRVNIEFSEMGQTIGREFEGRRSSASGL